MNISATSIVGLIKNYVQEYLNVPSTLPFNEKIFIFWVIILIAIAFAMIGRKAFRYILLISGALLGWFSSYFFAQFITGFISLPPLAINIVGALLGASFMFFLARFTISGGIAILTYYLIVSVLGIQSGYLLVVILIVFIVSMVFYKRAMNYITPILGGFLLYYAMNGLGYSEYEAIGLGALLAVIGIATHVLIKDRSTLAPSPQP